MKTFKINKKIEIVCQAKKTRNGFKHIATLMINNCDYESVKICYLNRTWEKYEYQSVLEKLVDQTKVLSEKEKKKAKMFIENYQESNNFKAIGLAMAMGNILCQTQKGKNDWQEKMLKAGLGNKGLIMPENWNELNEKTKNERLTGIKNMLLEKLKVWKFLENIISRDIIFSVKVLKENK